MNSMVHVTPLLCMLNGLMIITCNEDAFRA